MRITWLCTARHFSCPTVPVSLVTTGFLSRLNIFWVIHIHLSFAKPSSGRSIHRYFANKTHGLTPRRPRTVSKLPANFQVVRNVNWKQSHHCCSRHVLMPSILEDWVIWRCKEGSANGGARTTKLPWQITPKVPINLSSRGGEVENSSVFISLLATHQPKGTWKRSIHTPAGWVLGGLLINNDFPGWSSSLLPGRWVWYAVASPLLQAVKGSVPQVRHSYSDVNPAITLNVFSLSSTIFFLAHFTLSSSYSLCSGSALVHLDLHPSAHCPSISFFSLV